MMRKLPLLLLCAVLLAACAQAAPLTAPAQNADWPTASPASVGLDARKLNQAVELIGNGTYKNVDGILIIKNGRLAFEQYFTGYAWEYNAADFKGQRTDYSANTLHNLASVTKSFTSALIGIAIDQGLISGIEARVFEFFPRYAHLSDERKARMTLAHLLTMQAGLQWNENDYSYADARNDLIQLFRVPDPISYILAKPTTNEPGTKFYYSGGCTNLLGEVIRSVSGQRMDAFAKTYLFEPLGIASYQWDFINADMIHASGNLQLRPRDMAKLGYLYLKGGMWQGKRLVSEEWVRESVARRVQYAPDTGYGYQWWLRSYQVGAKTVDGFAAMGWGGQRIMVFPSMDMVVVFTGGNYVGREPVDDIIAQYILPAVQ
jgi:CubicO group peptidase (beta-lactamase class C family)